jgi:L-asparaginase
MKRIVILATGGTIAGAGENGKDIGYKSGSIKAQTLIDAIPELKDVANIFVEQVCNINSDDITSEIWISLARRIKELAVDGVGESHERVDGFVIMHGTDTMEETAFFLSLTLGVVENVDSQAAAKPVVLTGSMRPATAAEPDGPANLLFAVKSAVEMSERGVAGRVILSYTKLGNLLPSCCYPLCGEIEGSQSDSRHARFDVSSRPQCRDRLFLPVFVAFAGKLMDARTVQKVHANELDAFAEVMHAQETLASARVTKEKDDSDLHHACPGTETGGNSGGHVLEMFFWPAFDVSSLCSLPKVSVLYFNADADAELVRFAAERSAGLVIAGAGAGEFSQAWAMAIADVVAQSNIPVVVSTRINRGSIVPEQLLVPGTIAAYGLPPAKAAVLLRLSLTITKDRNEIQKIFCDCHFGVQN